MLGRTYEVLRRTYRILGRTEYQVLRRTYRMLGRRLASCIDMLKANAMGELSKLCMAIVARLNMSTIQINKCLLLRRLSSFGLSAS